MIFYIYDVLLHLIILTLSQYSFILNCNNDKALE